jgi:hypothetical protein
MLATSGADATVKLWRGMYVRTLLGDVCAANYAGEWQSAATVRPADFVANAQHTNPLQSTGGSALEPRQRDVFY